MIYYKVIIVLSYFFLICSCLLGSLGASDKDMRAKRSLYRFCTTGLFTTFTGIPYSSADCTGGLYVVRVTLRKFGLTKSIHSTPNMLSSMKSFTVASSHGVVFSGSIIVNGRTAKHFTISSIAFSITIIIQKKN